MKNFFVLAIFLLSFLKIFANHISGGELFYEYAGPGGSANSAKYKITMRLFRDCNSSGQTLETENVYIGIYDNSALSLYSTVKLPLQTPITTIRLNTDAIPCLVNAPQVCFQVGIFTRTVDLPVSAAGYILSWVRCCRIDLIANLSVPSGIGGTFTTTIPGTDLLPAGHNSSPQFAIKDTALVCQNKNFVLDFGASDPDTDSLSYSFCNAYGGGSSAFPNPGTDPDGLPQTLSLDALPYQSPYSGNSPLGPSVNINTATGKITGKAPSAGRYVINVCVTEWRNGRAINVHRKDFILAVGNCDYAGAVPIPATSAWCKDFTVNFSNNNTSSVIQSYYWDFGVPGVTTDTSTQPVPDFKYPDTGIYTIKLIVTGSAGCIDSGTTTLGVYPGFKPDFEVTGSCFRTPFRFFDKTTIAYGVITGRKWDFGDLTSGVDVSALQNPTYKYPAPANNNVTLMVTSSKGCIDTVTKTVAVTNIPLLKLPFKDTLICSVDTLQLHAIGTGVFSWTPAYNIINTTSPDPLVYPKDTATYVVSLVQDGCSTTDSVKVNVLDYITLYAGADTTICRTDTFTLKPVSFGLQYLWTPPDGLLSEPNIKNPVARPDTTTVYYLTASLGKCQAKDTIKITVAPYPTARAGSDERICYGDRAQLSGSIIGTSFTWSPASSLVNFNTLTPVAGPVRTTNYVLTVRDAFSGCPKPSYDTVTVRVIPPLTAFAGNDTSIVANQPLQLNATGGSIYAWTPFTGMNNTSIANPVITLGPSYDSIVYKLRVSIPEGCFAEDEIKVTVFKTGPDIFVPTAFTPNHDGKNDVLKPIPVGISGIKYFRIYNRWGQMLYSTSQIGAGWDGTLAGKEQATGTYVFMTEGTDYLGKSIFRKGTVVLIR